MMMLQTMPPRRRRPHHATCRHHHTNVSIHVSTQKATVERYGKALCWDVSIHASTQEATQAIAFFERHGLELLPQQKAALIENMLASVQQINGGAFTNLANTSAIGVRSVGLDGRVVYRGFREAYMDIVDGSIADMATGGGFDPVFRQALRQFADSGVRVVDYASGWSQRLDSFLRRSILDGVRDIWQANHDRVGAAFGADGVELSAHGGCADDHLPYQGKQFTNKQFKRLQSDLERPIGHWNCRHIAFPILMGISRPAHTASELARLYEMSTRKV